MLLLTFNYESTRKNCGTGLDVLYSWVIYCFENRLQYNVVPVANADT
jgi:hypothetical protein